MKRRASLFVLAALMLLSACTPKIPDEPSVSVSATEENVSVTDTLPAPEPTDEVTDEETLSPETEETTEETTEEVTDEATETSPLENMSAKQLLDFSQARTSGYSSFRRRTLTSLAVNVLGSETYTETDSELELSELGAVFRRGGKDGFEYLYLVGEELYTENELGKCRIGGYSREKFLSLVIDMPISGDFVGGEIAAEDEEYILTFTQLGDEGREAILKMLGLPEEYSISFDETDLEMHVDASGDMISSVIRISLSVRAGETLLMTVDIRSDTEQSDIGAEVAPKLPAAADYVYFTDDGALEKYSALMAEISAFTSTYEKFEYSVSDGMLISSGAGKLPLSSKTVYAYNSKVGASIDKSFDLGDGTGRHTTLTHFNRRRGFSQIDGGSIFVDTTINANNLAFTLSYPFTTSIFGFEHCIGMNPGLSDGNLLAFDLTEAAVSNIAGNLLVRAGVLSSSAKITESVAYTYIRIGRDGKVAAIGYEFSAKAEVGGKLYELERRVELEIVSRDSANVIVIYIEVDDED